MVGGHTGNVPSYCFMTSVLLLTLLNITFISKILIMLLDGSSHTSQIVNVLFLSLILFPLQLLSCATGIYSGPLLVFLYIPPLGSIVSYCNEVSYYFYADDTQIYFPFKP